MVIDVKHSLFDPHTSLPPACGRLTVESDAIGVSRHGRCVEDIVYSGDLSYPGKALNGLATSAGDEYCAAHLLEGGTI